MEINGDKHSDYESKTADELADLHQHQHGRFRPSESLDAGGRVTKTFNFEILDDPELQTSEFERAGVAVQHSNAARRHESYQALEQRVDELEKRLELQEDRHREEQSALSQSRAATGENDELVEFFLTEMEKYQTMTTKLSLAHGKLQQELHEHQQLMQRHQSEQSVRMHKYLEITRRMEKEFVHGERLRGEEKQLALAQSKRRIEAVKRLVSEQLTELKRQEEHQREQLEDKLEKRFVDVVVENQSLKAENMELRGDLQHVSALARSNKKTIRMLTEEILKIKRTAVVCPTEVDELAAFRRLSDWGVVTKAESAAATAQVHPRFHSE
ncbi:hypothetical protein Gpo141_00007094 [Globisporangium polare]